MSSTSSSQEYKATRNFIIRTPVWHRDKFANLSTYRELLQALPSILEESSFKLALKISSPSLLDQLDRLVENSVDVKIDNKTRRALRSLRKYLIRMTHRSTPFGLMSGVAMGKFTNGDSTLERSIETTRTVEVFTDYAWLMRLVDNISEKDVDGILPTALNPYVQRLGERLDVAHTNVFGLDESNHVDLRATSATDTIIELANRGCSRSEMIDILLERHNDVDRETVANFVASLTKNGIIFDGFKPGLVPGQELSEILAILKKFSSFDQIYQDLSYLDQLCRRTITLDALESRWESLCEQQDKILDDDSKASRLVVNSSVALRGDLLNEVVARRVEDVASILSRTNFFPQRNPYLVDYEQLFLERYGVEGEVPLLELLSAAKGLEAPDTYRLPGRSYPLTPMPREERTERVTALIDAYCDAIKNRTSMELSDDLVDLHSTTDSRPPNPSVEYFVRIFAESKECIDRGDFDMLLQPDGIAPGGRSIGRFTGMLKTETKDLVDDIFANEKRLIGKETLLVQLRYMPNKARIANVARTLDVTTEIMNLNVAGPSSISLGNVLVGNDGTRFYLRDLTSGRRMRIVENHMLNTLDAPNAIRFMLDVSNDWFRSFNMFDWGPLREASFLPRVERSRTIYSSARWNIKPTLVKSIDSSSARERVDKLRSLLNLPNEVYLVQDDNRLPLDLTTEIDCEIFAEELSRAQDTDAILRVDEIIGNHSSDSVSQLSDRGPEKRERWFRDAHGNGYEHELVVPVVWTGKPLRSSAIADRRICSTIAQNSHDWNARWVCIDVYGGLQNLDEIAGVDLAKLRDATSSLTSTWFFIRYPIPAHRLRVRMLASSTTNVEQLRSTLLTWASKLLSRSMIYDYELVSFVPEINRFGGPSAYDKALLVFEKSSVFASYVSCLRKEGAFKEVSDDVVGVFMLNCCEKSFGISPRDLSSSPSKDQHFRDYYRSIRRQLMDVLSDGRLTGVDSISQDNLEQLSSDLSCALAEYMSELKREELDSVVVRGAVGSVIHMMFNRVFPVGNDVEQRALDLWVLASEAFERRRQALA